MIRLSSIQALRALAAISIVFLHAAHDAQSLARKAGIAFEPSSLLPLNAGVDLFFVISGFVMVFASRDLFASSGAARLFLARRIARIVPLYWLTTSLYLGIALCLPRALNNEFLEIPFVIASYLFIPMARPDGLVQPLYSLGWTLNAEMFFYLIFASVLFSRLRHGLFLLSAFLILLTVIGSAVSLPQPFAFWTDAVILEFLFGGLMGWARLEGRSLPSFQCWALVFLAFLLLMADMPAPRWIAYGVPAALLVIAGGLGDRSLPASWAGPAERIGDASYALYLIHPFIIRAGVEIFLRGGLVIQPWLFIGLALAASVVAALFVHGAIERPMTNAIRRWLRV